MATQKEIAEHLCLTTRNVGPTLKRVGLPTTGNSLDDARTSYILYLREVASGRAGNAETSTYDIVEERARLAHHQANKTSLEEDVLKGDLIPAEEVLKSWEKMVSSFRAKMLSMPTKTSHLLVNVKEFDEVEVILKTHVYEALKELSNESTDENIKADI